MTAVTLTAPRRPGRQHRGDDHHPPAAYQPPATIAGDNDADIVSEQPAAAPPPNDDLSSTFICSGQTGTVSVRVASALGGGVSGRLVRFDIVRGAFQIFTELLARRRPSRCRTRCQPIKTGNAVARIRANQRSPAMRYRAGNGREHRRLLSGVPFVIVPTTNANARGSWS